EGRADFPLPDGIVGNPQQILPVPSGCYSIPIACAIDLDTVSLWWPQVSVIGSDIGLPSLHVPVTLWISAPC
ncbi:MAG: hypothetical protein AB7V33_09905, partial [Halothiobacillus sp.]